MNVFFIVVWLHSHAFGYYPTVYENIDLCDSDSEFLTNRTHLDTSKDVYLECRLFYNYHKPQGK